MPFATARNGRISYAIVGPTEPDGDPQTLLMIMGLAGSGAMWFRLLPHISRYHRAIVFDNRGTGDSSPARAPLTMRTMTDDAVAVLDAAAIDSAHVMGASMGGMIAQHLALDHRVRVRSLILACTTAVGRGEGPNLRLTAASLLRPWIGPRRTFSIVAPVLYSRRSRAEAGARLQEDRRIRASDRIRAYPAATGVGHRAARHQAAPARARGAADTRHPRARRPASAAVVRTRARGRDPRRPAGRDP
jgi:pimeloyl-ACP methyl ester carboxylesterase